MRLFGEIELDDADIAPHIEISIGIEAARPSTGGAAARAGSSVPKYFENRDISASRYNRANSGLNRCGKFSRRDGAVVVSIDRVSAKYQGALLLR